MTKEISNRSHAKLSQFWRDECGTVSLTSMLVATGIFSLGVLVGLATLRDHVVQQYGDVAVGLDHLDQSWSYETGIDNNGDGDCIDPGECEFQGEFIDTSTLNDPVGSAPADLEFR